MVKNMPTMQETLVQSLGRENPLEKGMATHSSILAWKIPWKRSLVGYNPWGLRVRHNWCGPFMCAHSYLTFAIPWTITFQAPLSMGFPRQEYWSGLPFPPPGDLPHPGIEPASPVLQADSLPMNQCGSPWPFYTHTQ